MVDYTESCWVRYGTTQFQRYTITLNVRNLVNHNRSSTNASKIRGYNSACNATVPQLFSANVYCSPDHNSFAETQQPTLFTQHTAETTQTMALTRKDFLARHIQALQPNDLDHLDPTERCCSICTSPFIHVFDWPRDPHHDPLRTVYEDRDKDLPIRLPCSHIMGYYCLLDLIERKCCCFSCPFCRRCLYADHRLRADDTSSVSASSSTETIALLSSEERIFASFEPFAILDFVPLDMLFLLWLEQYAVYLAVWLFMAWVIFWWETGRRQIPLDSGLYRIVSKWGYLMLVGGLIWVGMKLLGMPILPAIATLFYEPEVWGLTPPSEA